MVIVELDFCQEGLKKEALVILVMRPWVKIDPMHFPPRLHFVFYVSPAASWKFTLMMNKRGETFFLFFIFNV